MLRKHSFQPVQWIVVSLMILSMSLPATGFANDGSDETLYRKLSGIVIGQGDSSLFDRLNNDSRSMAWDRADETEFVGNLRI